MIQKDITTVDELIKLLNQLSEKMEEYSGGHDNGERLADLLMNAEDPDSRFKARVLLQIINIMDNFKVLIRYLAEPVKLQGKMLEKLDGNIIIKDTVIPEGTYIEFWRNGEWEFGRTTRNDKTGRMEITKYDDYNAVLCPKPDQIIGRIRQIHK